MRSAVKFPAWVLFHGQMVRPRLVHLMLYSSPARSERRCRTVLVFCLFIHSRMASPAECHWSIFESFLHYICRARQRSLRCLSLPPSLWSWRTSASVVVAFHENPERLPQHQLGSILKLNILNIIYVCGAQYSTLHLSGFANKRRLDQISHHISRLWFQKMAADESGRYVWGGRRN